MERTFPQDAREKEEGLDFKFARDWSKFRNWLCIWFLKLNSPLGFKTYLLGLFMTWLCSKFVKLNSPLAGFV